MPYYSTDEVVQHLTDFIEANKVTLGVAKVYYGEQSNIPAFPAVMVAGAPLGRELHGTRTFKLTFTVFIYVIDAKLSNTKSQRIKTDLQTAKNITELVHTDLTLGGNITFGFITSDEAGVLAKGMGAAVVGTRLTYTGEQIKGF